MILLLLSSYVYFMLALTTMFFLTGFYDDSIKQAGLSSALFISIKQHT